jgi:RNA-directed DNA polymerase
MDVEQQQGTWTQLSLFEVEGDSVCPGASGEGGTGPAAFEEWQASTASNRGRALTGNLMERVCERENLNRAYKRVKANKGAPGIDGRTVGGLYEWLREHKEELVGSLLEGSYKPQPVLGKEIDKPGGGKRRLGIPTVVDRLVQQSDPPSARRDSRGDGNGTSRLEGMSSLCA